MYDKWIMTAGLGHESSTYYYCKQQLEELLFKLSEQLEENFLLQVRDPNIKNKKVRPALWGFANPVPRASETHFFTKPST